MRSRPAITILCVAALAVAACSSSSKSGSSDNASTTTAAVAATQPRPSGPAADMSQELTGGNGVFIGSATTTDFKKVGYVEHEYAASGTATSYKAVGAMGSDGRWTFAPDTTAPYKTRVLVRRPANPKKFSGTVVVEWLNVSGGVDADPDWVSLREELIRAGDAWVGVSAQRIGVEGGPVLVKVDVPGSEAAGKGLKAIDPARYGSLSQPGDGYSFDIFTQVARAVREGAGLGGPKPARIIAAGESQSAIAMVTYVNGVQPLTHAFDGFFVHSRGSTGLPLVGPGKYADLAGALSKPTPTILRTDTDVPIMDIQTETDVSSILDSFAARQPDTDHFRLWEVAGTAHADQHLIGPNNGSINCGGPINDGPMHLVAKAALRSLTTWMEDGKAPVIAPRLETTGADHTIVRNSDGIAQGGIRTPPVDVPVAALSGAPGPVSSTICLLLGSSKPFTAARLAQLYSSRAEYVKQYDADASRTIKAGFVLPQDRAALLGFAEPSRIAG